MIFLFFCIWYCLPKFFFLSLLLVDDGYDDDDNDNDNNDDKSWFLYSPFFSMRYYSKCFTPIINPNDRIQFNPVLIVHQLHSLGSILAKSHYKDIHMAATCQINRCLTILKFTKQRLNWRGRCNKVLTHTRVILRYSHLKVHNNVQVNYKNKRTNEIWPTY